MKNNEPRQKTKKADNPSGKNSGIICQNKKYHSSLNIVPLLPEGSKNVEALVVSAPSGFIDSDTSTPIVSLP